MDRSAYLLSSRQKFVEIAARMLTGEYKNTTGFIRHLAEFFATAGDFAGRRKRGLTRDIFI